MNVRRGGANTVSRRPGGIVRQMLLGVLFSLGTVLPTQARGIVDHLTVPWTDPLQANPAVLERGRSLPGDSAVPPCPARFNARSALTLVKAIDLALCRNNQISAAWAGIKIQAAAVGEARAAYLPTINGAVSGVNDRTSYPHSRYDATTIKSNTAYGNLSWRLFDFGGRNADNHSAMLLLDAALASYDATIQKALTSAIGAYFDAQRAWEIWTLQQEGETVAGQTVQAAQRRESRGYGSLSDTLQAKAALSKATMAKTRAQGEFQKALAVLLYETGLPAATAVVLPKDDDAPTEGMQHNLHQWLADVQAHHPAIVAARARLDAAREKVVVTRSEGLPTVDLTANIYQNGRPDQGPTPSSTREAVVGVTVNIPLFDGFSRGYKIQGAQAQVELQEQKLEDVSRQTLADFVKAHADATASLGNLAASVALLHAAQEAQASVQRKFERGAADIVELLNGQSALLDAQQERVRCVTEWRSARLRLFSTAGALGRSRLEEGTNVPSLP